MTAGPGETVQAARKALRCTRPRRGGALLIGLLASVLVAMVCSASASAASDQAVHAWSQAIKRISVPGVGCFRASYPALAWRKSACKAPLRRPRLSSGGAPSDWSAPDAFGQQSASGMFGAPAASPTAGGNTGGMYAAEVPTGVVTSAVGSFPSVSAGPTEEDSKRKEKETYSLQLNTNFFKDAAKCAGSKNAAGCGAGQQFVFSQTESGGELSFEYVIVGYAEDGSTCPGGYAEIEGNCYKGSPRVSLPAIVKVSELASVSFEAKANGPGNLDSIVMITKAGSAVATGAADELDLGTSKEWKRAEFGVFGWANESVAEFSPNTTITINTAVNATPLSDLAPICSKGALHTLEANNLSFEGTPALAPQSSPTISSRQTNGTVEPGPQCTTYGVSPPSVTITQPVNAGVYTYGQSVPSEFECTPAAGATLKSCTGTNDGKGINSGEDINTRSSTSNTFEVTAEDSDGQKTTVKRTYTVDPQQPKATISYPFGGGFYKVGAVVPTKFFCEEGALGTTLESCDDNNGTETVFGGEGTLPTSMLGSNTYKVTARSTDGESGAANISYTVVEPPKATIIAPTGGVFELGQSVATMFACKEGASGPGLASCDDSNGKVTLEGGAGTLPTSSVGPHTYTVTATSKDGLSAIATLNYIVALRLSAATTSCNSFYFGVGATVQVPAGGDCTLVAGTTVTGSVQALKPGGALVDEGAVIGADLQVDNAASIELYGGGSIGGNLLVVGLTGAPAAGDNALCDTTVDGDLQILGNGAHSPIDIGDLGACAGGPGLTAGGYLQLQGSGANVTVAGSSFGGYLRAWGNHGKVTISTNSAAGNIEVDANTGGVGSTLTDNSSNETCILTANSPKIVGTLNSAKITNSCNRTA
jgi:hypothetical protein